MHFPPKFVKCKINLNGIKSDSRRIPPASPQQLRSSSIHATQLISPMHLNSPSKRHDCHHRLPPFGPDYLVPPPQFVACYPTVSPSLASIPSSATSIPHGSPPPHSVFLQLLQRYNLYTICDAQPIVTAFHCLHHPPGALIF